jgi:hypothetical protein
MLFMEQKITWRDRRFQPDGTGAPAAGSLVRQMPPAPFQCQFSNSIALIRKKLSAGCKYSSPATKDKKRIARKGL